MATTNFEQANYYNMSEREFFQKAKEIKKASVSLEEFKERLKQELGYPHNIESLPITIGEDFFRNMIGGVVLKSGVTALALLHGRQNGTFFV